MIKKTNHQGRREFLKTSAAMAISLSIPLSGFTDKKTPVIILRSSWQTVNIGDIGHTPGVLALLEKYIPQAQVRLWPSDVGNGVEQMLAKRFPKVEIIKTDADRKRAMSEADFMLHGSGPSLVARATLEEWAKTGKPYGVYGITFPGVYGTPEQAKKASPKDVELLNNARFAFFRDSVSLNLAKEIGVKCPIMEFGPDGAFAVDVKDDESAIRFLKEHDLQEGRFLCVIPRYRYTPWWKIPSKNRTIENDKDAINQKMKEHDNGPIRDAIVAVIRQTSMKVLICPEDETQMEIGKEMLYDKLPEDVKSRVVLREKYWLTDQAVSTYIRSAGLFGLEMHSPIMCVGNGIPATVGRFAEQTSKGLMWKDIGLGDWLFDMDVPGDVSAITPAVLAIAKDPKTAKKKALKARDFVIKRQRETMEIVKKNLYS
ncbi:polysaccharide pyruvyl transferase family protein [Dyadobacter psychrotolerans]|uniref:Polysaccharide pyruvyl transferase family protein n=1 Tax=Dyadobacter psychrotolerans TaxID=2541721 RepID=A0A4R5DMV2_9BACT|nr:polysaccharide pyruvyl transferase family protein [Dyadobacter psychrotolerans]TDE14857.1 polysaccharide pyruvyl transferase family protein [Dyadobacter psychrotolerans]